MKMKTNHESLSLPELKRMASAMRELASDHFQLSEYIECLAGALATTANIYEGREGLDAARPDNQRFWEMFAPIEHPRGTPNKEKLPLMVDEPKEERKPKGKRASSKK